MSSANSPCSIPGSDKEKHRFMTVPCPRKFIPVPYAVHRRLPRQGGESDLSGAGVAEGQEGLGRWVARNATEAETRPKQGHWNPRGVVGDYLGGRLFEGIGDLEEVELPEVPIDRV